MPQWRGSPDYACFSPTVQFMGRYFEIPRDEKQLIQQRCPTRAEPSPAPRGCLDGNFGHANVSQLLEPQHPIHILHDGKIPEATELFKGLAAHEDGLISVGQFGPMHMASLLASLISTGPKTRRSSVWCELRLLVRLCGAVDSAADATGIASNVTTGQLTSKAIAGGSPSFH
jgi:hypothetical protein